MRLVACVLLIVQCYSFRKSIPLVQAAADRPQRQNTRMDFPGSNPKSHRYLQASELAPKRFLLLGITIKPRLLDSS